jgi:hypothetical protein
MKYLKTVIMVFCLSACGTAIQGQNAIPATGSNASGSGGSASYSIGQVTYQILSGTTGTVAQGVQQPYEISVVTAIANTEGITLEYKVFPNPTRGLTTLTVKPYNHENIRYQIYDLNGVLLQDKKVESEETDISLERFSFSMYFLKILSDNKEIKVFKIIKR